MTTNPAALKQADTSRKSYEEEKPIGRVHLSKWLLIFFISVIILISLPVYFYFSTFTGPLGDQDLFAKFGDFIGGTVNPLLGFVTIGLLLVSIAIQREELRATREELKEAKQEAALSRQAMEQQVLHFEKEAVLSELTRLLKDQSELYQTLVVKPMHDQDGLAKIIDPRNVYPEIVYRYSDVIEEAFAEEYQEDVVSYIRRAINMNTASGKKWGELADVLENVATLTMEYYEFSQSSIFGFIYLHRTCLILKKFNGVARNEALEKAIKGLEVKIQLNLSDR